MSTDGSHSQQEVDVHHTEILKRVGNVTRILHNSLRHLGFDKAIEQFASEIPETRDRLTYVTRKTEQAAERVLNATEIAMPLQENLCFNAEKLTAYWKELLSAPVASLEMDIVGEKTLQFLQDTQVSASETKSQLLEIMMAQDFQDLTGQVLKTMTTLTRDIEQQLAQILIDFTSYSHPGANTNATVQAKTENAPSLLNGPQINPDGNKDVVASQSQVDDLLDSLGF